MRSTVGFLYLTQFIYHNFKSTVASVNA